jgi:hypothetical protein
MDSTLLSKVTDDPCDAVVMAPDAAQVAPSDKELSSLLHQAARCRVRTQTSSDVPGGPTAPPVDTTFRPTSDNDVPGSAGRSKVRRALRALLALSLAAGSGLAALTWNSYGDAAKAKVAELATHLSVSSPRPPEDQTLAAQPAVRDAAPPQPATFPPTAPESVATAAADPSSPQLLQSMAQDLAAQARELEQLKASVEQLKVSQQQLVRDVAKSSEQNLATKTLAPRPRAAAAPVERKPTAFYGAQAAAARGGVRQAAEPYYTPRQPEPRPGIFAEPELSSVPRPPMPVR